MQNPPMHDPCELVRVIHAPAVPLLGISPQLLELRPRIHTIPRPSSLRPREPGWHAAGSFQRRTDSPQGAPDGYSGEPSPAPRLGCAAVPPVMGLFPSRQPCLSRSHGRGQGTPRPDPTPRHRRARGMSGCLRVAARHPGSEQWSSVVPTCQNMRVHGWLVLRPLFGSGCGA